MSVGDIYSVHVSVSGQLDSGADLCIIDPRTVEMYKIDVLDRESCSVQLKGFNHSSLTVLERVQLRVLGVPWWFLACKAEHPQDFINTLIGFDFLA